MNVTLLHATHDPELVAGLAAYLCRNTRSARSMVDKIQVLDGDDYSRILKSLESAIESGHLSVVEHVSYTFFIDDITRACSHQLVRHRIASYTQASQRAGDGDPRCFAELLLPQHLKAQYQNAMDVALGTYKNMIAGGIPPEDARFVLPNAALTTLMMTMNARELYHFLQIRLCNKAQWEIGMLARLLWHAARDHFPLLFASCGPPCKNGQCMEKRPCKEGMRDEVHH